MKKKIYSLFVFLTLIGTSVFGQITLSFQITNTPCYGCCCGSAIVAASGGVSPYTYLWNDSLMNTSSNASNLCAGTYMVTVTDSQNNTSVGTVTISQPTAIVINVIPHYPTSPISSDGYIEASASGGNPPYVYMWSNNELSSIDTNLVAGIYGLTVTDANGCTVSTTVDLNNGNNASCQAAFYAMIDSTNTSSTTYSFIDYSHPDSTSTIISYYWNFDDGTTSTAQNTTHAFGPGSHNVCLTISTSSGCSNTFCDSVYVNPTTPCQAEFLYNATILNCGPYCVQFYDSSYATSSITSWLWTFGDSTTSTLQSPAHTFPGYGSYNVCLTIQTASGCSSSFCQQINVEYPAFCQAAFSYYLDSLNTSSPYTINFINQSTTDSLNSIIGYSWNFSDGSTSTLVNPSHVFNFTANYEVCLTITTANGCTNTYCDSVLVTNAPCTIFASVNSHSPSTIGGNDGYIESTISGGTSPYSYVWNNNETTPNIYNLTSGGYILTITDANGCQNILSATLYEPYDTTGGPIVDTLYTNVIDTCLNFVPDSFYVSSIVVDTATNTATVTWTLNNNSQTSSFTVTYVYTQYGNTMVVLTLNCGTKTLTTYQSYVHITSNLSAPVNNYYSNISAYPVPFNDKLIINYTSQKSDNTTILLMDATGRIVASEKIISIAGKNYSEINTSSLPSGVYILSIETKDGIFREQVVK